MNSLQSPDQRTDEELDGMLAEAGQWAIDGQRGQALSLAPSLRHAIDTAATHSATGAVVTALRRLPIDDIVVLPAQITRLKKLIAGREVAPIKYAEAWVDVNDDARDGHQV